MSREKIPIDVVKLLPLLPSLVMILLDALDENTTEK
jgi:hypothetical protein